MTWPCCRRWLVFPLHSAPLLVTQGGRGRDDLPTRTVGNPEPQPIPRKVGRGLRKVGRGLRKVGRGLRKVGRGLRKVGRGLRKVGRGLSKVGRGLRKVGSPLPTFLSSIYFNQKSI